MDSPGRHEQLFRVFHLVDLLLAARQPLTVAGIKAALRDRGVIDDMSDRNLRRDIAFLLGCGYDVRETSVREGPGAARKAWRIEPSRGRDKAHGPAVTLPELLSLAVAREFLAPLAGTCYWRGIGRVVQRIEAVATPALLEHLDGLRDGLVIHPRPAAGKYPVVLLNAVHRAIRRSQELVIRYRGAADDRPKRVVVRPEALVVYEGSLYLAATKVPARGAVADDAPRFYKLDRCTSARLGTATFTPRAGGVESLLEDSVTIFRAPGAPRRFRIRIGPARARWAVEKPFHPRQRVVAEADGGVVLEIERGWEDELVPRVLSLADEAEILEPADVRQRLRDAAARIVARYDRPAPAPRRKT